MIFRALDSDNDWKFGRGKSDFLKENSAIGLNIKTRIKSWVNDCFFDMTAGIDWSNRIGSKDQKSLLDADLKRIIITSENVTSLLSFSSTLIGREYTADFSVETIYSSSYQSQITLGV